MQCRMLTAPVEAWAICGMTYSITNTEEKMPIEHLHNSMTCDNRGNNGFWCTIFRLAATSLRCGFSKLIKMFDGDVMDHFSSQSYSLRNFVSKLGLWVLDMTPRTLRRHVCGGSLRGVI